jgi:hypothetical protein
VSETILAIIAACAIIAAVLMVVFAYQFNKTLDEQNRLIKRMNDGWLDFIKIAIRGEERKRNE